MVVTTLKIDISLHHCRIHVWNRGAKAGVLTVGTKDADYFLSVLSVSGTQIFYQLISNIDYGSYKLLYGSIADIITREYVNVD